MRRRRRRRRGSREGKFDGERLRKARERKVRGRK